MSLRPVLRLIALGIAVAGALDPAITRSVATPAALTIVAIDDDAAADALRLADRWGADFTVHAAVHATGSGGAACPSAGACVLVSSGGVPERLTAGASVVGAVLRNGRRSPAMSSVRAPEIVPLGATATLDVMLARDVPRIDVLDAGVLVGSVETATQGAVRVPWVPAASGARTLRVEAGDEVVDVGVLVQDAAVPALVYEPEPTWLGTFVRRALEDAGEIEVEGSTRVAPAISVRRGSATGLTAAALEEAAVVIVTAPHALSERDVQLLERFVRVRGGSLLVLPESRPTGAITRLLPPTVDVHVVPSGATAGGLRGREWLIFGEDAATTALQRLERRPVIVSRAVGRGRVIVSGALDAWEFRAASAFPEVWPALVADAARAAGPALDLRASRAVVRPGQSIRLTIARRSMTPISGEIRASGEYSCGNNRGALRLWPRARPGTFEATLRPPAAGECVIRVDVNDETATLPVRVTNELHEPADRAALAAMVVAHGGEVVASDGIEQLRARLDREPTTIRAVTTYPMRSAWWLLPFVGCVAAEWLLRRRAGLS